MGKERSISVSFKMKSSFIMAKQTNSFNRGLFAYRLPLRLNVATRRSPFSSFDSGFFEYLRTVGG